LVAKGLTWSLVAGTANGFRTFRVSRIEDARVLESASERPSDFDLAAYWKASTTEFMESRRQLSLTIRIHPEAAELLKHRCRPSRLVTPSVPDAEGWMTLEADFDDEDQAVFVALGFGARIEVIAPEKVRERVAQEIAAMFNRQAGKLARR
jgi:predicted DNA-binding transcriptional regulator YafY